MVFRDRPRDFIDAIVRPESQRIVLAGKCQTKTGRRVLFELPITFSKPVVQFCEFGIDLAGQTEGLGGQRPMARLLEFPAFLEMASPLSQLG